jgi:hypothetical protein
MITTYKKINLSHFVIGYSLEDKDDIQEKNPSTFHCRTLDWDANVKIRKVVNHVRVTIELYVLR